MMKGHYLAKHHRLSTSIRPFRQDSIWNQPVPAGVSTTALANTTGVLWLDSWNTTPGTPARPGISNPVYYAAATDPLVPVWWDFNNYTNVNSSGFPRWGLSGPQETTIKGEWFNGFTYASRATPFMNLYSSTTQNSTGTLWTAPASFIHKADASSLPRQVRVPGGFAYPASGTDGWLTVVQPDGTVFECIQAIWLSTGELTCSDYAITDPTDYGDGFNNGQCTTMIPCYAGLITQRDINQGVIDHAIGLAWPATHLASSIVYPAYAMDKDGGVAGGGQYTGNEPMGSRLIIPAATNIAGHTWTSSIGLMVATALQTYGGFIVDRSGGPNLKVEANVTSSLWNSASFSTAAQTDLTFIYANWLVRVTTSYPTPSGR